MFCKTGDVTRLSSHVRGARRPERKELRLAAIMDAARSPALENGVRAVTLTDIAARTGINKSAVLRYVETREDIHLRLTAEGWTRWAAALRETPEGRLDGTADELAKALCTTPVEQPLLCDRLAHTALRLERHVSAEAVLAYKLRRFPPWTTWPVPAPSSNPFSTRRQRGNSSAPSACSPAPCGRSPLLPRHWPGCTRRNHASRTRW
ncbi:hypothetical protein GCM10010358_80670 [Streptomyces minutiscleroticus]|uniref:HTH tetR-type domain-containing protein n=1 Tax=Streptomyces minutiscleroticus TaxID=68238 RepID=A0A918P3J7_9ACTN|nr:hypothetical protein GCM10010358_80670 [Streptomyces minutiscleroticus]